MHFRLVDLIKSWLEQRQAHVVVGGEKSEAFFLSNMIFQGTVLGPMLWNLFFGDAREAVRFGKVIEIIFLDDLNASRSFCRSTKNTLIVRSMNSCQARLHSWGDANRV